MATQSANAVAITGGTASLSSLALTTALPLTSGGTGATTALSARTNLGLGTAAIVDIGTSGSTIPLLNTTNTWSGGSIYTGAISINGPASTGYSSPWLSLTCQNTDGTINTNIGIRGNPANNGSLELSNVSSGSAKTIIFSSDGTFTIPGDLQFGSTSSSYYMKATSAVTSVGVGTGGYRAIEPGSDTASFDNMNNINLTSWYGIGFCTSYNSPSNGVIAGKPAAFINTRTGNFYARNAVFSNTTQLTSDRNAKENIEEIPDDLELVEKILGLKTYTFSFKNSGQPSAGFIAQDVEEIFPDYVHYIEDIDHLSLDYTAVNAYLHKAVVMMYEKMNVQESTVNAQQAQIDELKAMVQALTNK